MSDTETSGETELSGRTPSLMVSREIFARTCEFSRNYNLTKAEALALFETALQSVSEVWAIEAGNTEIRIQSGKNFRVVEGTFTVPQTIMTSKQAANAVVLQCAFQHMTARNTFDTTEWNLTIRGRDR